MSHNCAQPFETNGLPYLVTRRDDGTAARPYTAHRAHIYRNLKIYQYIYRYTLYRYTGLYRYIGQPYVYYNSKVIVCTCDPETDLMRCTYFLFCAANIQRMETRGDWE
jgi:hypothetical protein